MRRRGDFGLNTPFSILRLHRYFFSETIFFGASQVSCRRALCGCRGGVKTTKISHQEKDGYLFSPSISTSAPPACPLRSGFAVDAHGCGG